MASASPGNAVDDDHEEEDPLSEPSAPDPGNCEISADTSMYGQFTWTVALPAAPADKDSLADISKIRQFSDVFEVGGYEWKLEMYPYGDSQSDKTLSVFLCAVDRKQLPGWSQTAHYQIAVVNKDPSKTSTHTGYDIFRGKRDSAWGWSKLINLSKLHDVSQGWVDDEGKITLQATVHVVTHEYMPVNRTYRKSLCGLYYERVLQSYFEPFLKDELQRLDKLCGNSVLHKGFSDFWASLPDAKKRQLLQITMDEVLLNVKARLFSRDQPATYLAADVIFKAAHDCSHGTLSEGAHRSLVGCTSLAVVSGGEGTVLRLERLTPEASSGLSSLVSRHPEQLNPAVDQVTAGTLKASSRVMLRTHGGVMRMSNSANFVDVFRAQVSDALDNVRALVKHLKPQSCDGTCLEAMGRQMLAVFAMCGMYITNVHPAYHEKLALQLQEDLIREEEEKNLKAQAKKAKQAEKKKKQQEMKAQKRAEEEEAKKKAEEEEKKRQEAEKEAKRKKEEEQSRKKAEARKKAQEEAEKQRRLELEAEEKRQREEAERKAREEEEEAARQAALASEQEEESVGEEEKARKSQIAAIMRDMSLTPVERQARIQAILAGKVDVMTAPAGAAGAAGAAASAAVADHSNGPAGASAAAPSVNNVPATMSTGGQAAAGGAPPAAAAAAAAANARAAPVQQPSHSMQPAVAAATSTSSTFGSGSMAPMQASSSYAPFNPISSGEPASDIDPEAFAINAINAIGNLTEEEDDFDVQAMALGTLDLGHQPWNVPEAGAAPAQAPKPYTPYASFSQANQAPAGGSRLFERWAGRGGGNMAPEAGMQMHQMPHANGIAHPNGPHNGNDSENEASIASTISGTRTPLGMEVDGMDGAMPDYMQETLATSCALSAIDSGVGDNGLNSRRRQFSFLIGYLGTEYSGLTHESANRTVQEEFLRVLRGSGAVSPDPAASTAGKLGWTHGCQTDYGVHAAAQCISVDMVQPRTSLDEFMHRLNSKLNRDVRVLGCAPCAFTQALPANKQQTARFDADRDASLRVFEYVVPSGCLAPIPENVLQGGLNALMDYIQRFQMNKNQEKTLSKALRQFQTGGSKSMPWYRAQWDFSQFTEGYGDGGAMGSIKSFACSERIVLSGIEHAVLRVEGTRFFPLQVQKMVGLTVRALQCRDGQDEEELIGSALQGDSNLQIPTALSHALILDRVSYQAEEAGGQPPAVLPNRDGWADINTMQQVQEFKRSLIHRHVGAPGATRQLALWLMDNIPRWG